MFMQSHIPKAVDEIDEFSEVVEKRFISLLVFLHSDSDILF